MSTAGSAMAAGSAITAASADDLQVSISAADGKDSHSHDAAAKGVSKDGNTPLSHASFWRYFMWCLVACILQSVVAVILWSGIGYGEQSLSFLEGVGNFQFACLLLGGLGLIALYLLDFFVPPHLPGTYCKMFAGDAYVGRSLLTVVAALFVTAGLLSAGSHPQNPLLITVLGTPLSISLVRMLARERPVIKRVDPGSPRSQETLLRDLEWQAADQKAFYLAVVAAFVLVGTVIGSFWVVWSLLMDNIAPTLADVRGSEHTFEVLYMLWAAPLIIAGCNLAFAGIISIRVLLDHKYRATDGFKNKLRLQLVTNAVHKQRENGGLSPAVIMALSNCDVQTPQKFLPLGPDLQQRTLVQHHHELRNLGFIMKIIGCAIVVTVSSYYIAAEFVISKSNLGLAVRNALFVMFAFFVFFIWSSFKRMWRDFNHQVRKTPVWRLLSQIAHSQWFRALALFFLIPFLPFCLALSALNQQVRNCRGIQDLHERCRSEAERDVEPGERPESTEMKTSCLTSNVAKAYQLVVADCAKIDMLVKMQVVGIGVVIYVVAPIMVDVAFAWLTTVLQDLPFALLVTVYYCVGMVAFLLPPVPGPSIYLFGGILIAEHCPWGLWWGTVICIAVSWVLKLSACAMQQKCIGEWLGSSMWVRRQSLVHTPLLRAIELVLREKGFSLGKVAILCGGPDWPTSVGAGVLGLPLGQMLVGTMPIILFIAPSVMTGTFYLKKDESEVWSRAASLMFAFTLLVVVLLTVGMTWAVQDMLDRRFTELQCPRAADVELHWLDWRAKQLSEACPCEWRDLPGVIRAVLAFGVVGFTVIGNTFYWFSDLCFSSVAAHIRIEELRVVGSSGALILYPGLIGLSVFGACLMSLCLFNSWLSRRAKTQATSVEEKLKEVEAGWKEQWLQEAEKANRALKMMRHSITECCQTAIESPNL